MAYEVLARKWRPRDFSQVVGQQHVLQVLTKAFENERLHHAYLFTGTRGVGKTTLARIVAKCLNCVEGVSAAPCGVCEACTSIDAGSFPDLIEVDAASRTKVEEMRELLSDTTYVPSQGRFKIYLIDEVHMLSAHSFNALLNLGIRYWLRVGEDTSARELASEIKRTRARIGRELGRLTPGAPNEAAFDSLITFTQAITDGDFESCARAAEDRTERIGAAADALIFEVRDYLRVI